MNDESKKTPSPDAQANGQPQPEGNDSPKGGSSLYSAGSKSKAAESTFEAKNRDKDGKPLVPEDVDDQKEKAKPPTRADEPTK